MKAEHKKQTAKYAGIAVCLLILCANIVILGLSMLDLGEQPDLFPYGLLAVESGSMEPVLSQGDLLLIHETPFAELEIGDTVTFYSMQGFVTHAIVSREGEQYITQGLANTLADPVPMRADTYCGKVIGHVPLLGWPVQAISDSPMRLMLCIALVIMLCIGQPLLEDLFQKKIYGKPAKYAAKQSYLSRGILCAALVSMFVSMPAVTQAKYLTRLQRYETVVAEPMYFSSNYLSAGQGNRYSIQGWTGNTYALNLEIRNYDNTLLYNGPDRDLSYGIGLLIVEDCGDYNISLEPVTQTALQSVDFPYPDDWDAGMIKSAYRLPGAATLQSHWFTISIEPKNENYIPVEGHKIAFEVHACTSIEETYFRELMGSFQLQVTAKGSFLDNKMVTDNGSMVTLVQQTNLVHDGNADGEKLVVFRWDPQKLYINEYQRTAFNAIHDENGRFDETNGLLYMRLQAYARIELEFFKKQDFEAGSEDIAVKVVSGFDDALPEISN